MSSPAEWASQAALAAALRYNPQLESLGDLQRAAYERFHGSVQAGKSEGTLASQAAQAAIAPTTQVYDQAGQEAAGARNLTSGVLQQIGATNPFAIAAANEQAAGTARLATTRAHALGELQQRKVAAAALPAYTRQAAQLQLNKELSSILAKRNSVLGARGADAQLEATRLREAAAKNALTERGQNLTRAGSKESNEQQERASQRSASAAHGGKPPSAAEQQKASGDYHRMLGIAQEAFAHGESRGSISKRLIAGRPEQSTAVNANGEPVKTVKNSKGETVPEHAAQHVKRAPIPSFAANGLMSAALDVAEQGYVSTSTQHQLEREKYDVHALGLPLQRSDRRGATEQGAEAVGKKVGRAINHFF